MEVFFFYFVCLLPNKLEIFHRIKWLCDALKEWKKNEADYFLYIFFISVLFFLFIFFFYYLRLLLLLLILFEIKQVHNQKMCANK